MVSEIAKAKNKMVGNLVVAIATDLHSKKKSTSEHLFFFGALGCRKYWTLFNTWKDQIVPGRIMIGILGSTWT